MPAYMLFESLVLQLEMGHCPLSPCALNLRIYRWRHFANSDEAQEDNVELQIVLSNGFEVLFKVANDNLKLEEMTAKLLLL